MFLFAFDILQDIVHAKVFVHTNDLG